MRRILRFFGLISFADLSLAAERYDYQQMNKARDLFSNNEDEEGQGQYYKGCGAIEFVEQLILEKDENP